LPQKYIKLFFTCFWRYFAIVYSPQKPVGTLISAVMFEIWVGERLGLGVNGGGGTPPVK
jgi:hypothetical protein